MKAIYKMDCNCGRMGSLSGVFIAEKEHVAVLIEKQIEVYFGEVLGKHSEIKVALNVDEIKMVSDNPEHVQLLESLQLSSGFNPFLYPCFQADKFGLEGDDWTVQDVIEFIPKQEKKSD